MIAEAIGCHERTLFRYIENYERVACVPAITIDALHDQGGDPAASKHAPIIDDLSRLPVPETREQAATVVAGTTTRELQLEARRKVGGVVLWS
jgi:hypothetical protein